MSKTKQWRGLGSLVEAAVEHGSRAIEKVQKDTAKTPFAILEQIPRIALPARGIHAIHDAAVGGVHEVIRGVNRAVGVTLVAVMDAVDAQDSSEPK